MFTIYVSIRQTPELSVRRKFIVVSFEKGLERDRKLQPSARVTVDVRKKLLLEPSWKISGKAKGINIQIAGQPILICFDKKRDTRLNSSWSVVEDKRPAMH